MQTEDKKNNVYALLKCIFLFFLSFYFLFLAIESSASSLLPQTLQERLRSSLEALEKPQQGQGSSRLYSLKALNLFYERNGFLPIWLDNGLVLQRANELRGAFEDARKEGLGPDDYHLEEIKRKLADWKGSLFPFICSIGQRSLMTQAVSNLGLIFMVVINS